MTYRDHVRARFPSDHDEVPHGYIGPVVDRITGRTGTIIQWDDDEHVSIRRGALVFSENSVWYVLPEPADA